MNIYHYNDCPDIKSRNACHECINYGEYLDPKLVIYDIDRILCVVKDFITNEVIGFLYFTNNRDDLYCSPYIFVRQDYRLKGIGTKLLDMGIRKAIEVNKPIKLLSYSDAAHIMIRKKGFTQCEMHKHLWELDTNQLQLPL